MKKIILVIAIFVLAGCVSIPIGTSYHNSWECEKLQSGDDYACKLIPDTFYYELNTSLNNSVYVGPVKDWGLNNYHPDGWGNINFANTKKYRIKFSSGLPKEIDAVFEDGDTYQGRVNEKLHWTNGTFKSDEVIYSGLFAFSSINKSYRYLKGKLENSTFIFDGVFYTSHPGQPKKGKFTHKKFNYDFDGSFHEDGKMQKGILTQQSYENNKECKRIFKGHIDYNEEGWSYNMRQDFILEQPNGTITKKNGS